MRQQHTAQAASNSGDLKLVILLSSLPGAEMTALGPHACFMWCLGSSSGLSREPHRHVYKPFFVYDSLSWSLSLILSQGWSVSSGTWDGEKIIKSPALLSEEELKPGMNWTSQQEVAVSL